METVSAITTSAFCYGFGAGHSSVQGMEGFDIVVRRSGGYTSVVFLAVESPLALLLLRSFERASETE